MVEDVSSVEFGVGKLSVRRTKVQKSKRHRQDIIWPVLSI